MKIMIKIGTIAFSLMATTVYALNTSNNKQTLVSETTPNYHNCPYYDETIDTHNCPNRENHNCQNHYNNNKHSYDTTKIDAQTINKQKDIKNLTK